MTLTDEIRETFKKVSLQHVAAKGLSGDDWAKYREIQLEHQQQERQEQRTFHHEYDTRLEAKRKQLVDQAASQSRHLLPRFLGRDGFDSAAIGRQAHRSVLADHDRAIANLAINRDTKIETLLDGAQRRQVLGEELKRDFTEATDRRDHSDRRSGPTR